MSREIVMVKCPECGCKKSYKNITPFSESGECISCGEMTYYKKTNEYTGNTSPTIKCPYCNSTNTKKISTVSKAAGVAFFGVFAVGKVVHQWHCNNCKSDF